jgi:prephenate dehydrogenase
LKIILLGMGHMGSWLARMFSRSHEVAAFDVKRERAAGINDVKTIEYLEEIESFTPDLLINAASLQNTIAAFKDVMLYVPSDCILSDMASIKGGLGTFYLKSGHRFVSVHPMFGPTFADMGSLAGESAIILKESCSEGMKFFKAFFEELGLNVFEYSFSEHDKMMAYSLTLPFISTMVFASCVDRDAVPGTTFAKHMKIAKGLMSEDDNLIGEVLFNAHSLYELDKITAMLEYLKHIVRDKDMEELSGFLNKLRKNMPSIAAVKQ